MNRHITRNIDARRAQLDVSWRTLEEASGVPRQTFYRVKENPTSASLKQLQRIAILLHVPLHALTDPDPGVSVRCPLPPPNWLDVIARNRDRYGFSAAEPVADFEDYLADVDVDSDDGGS